MAKSLLEQAQELVSGDVVTDPREVLERLDFLYEEAEGIEKIKIGQLEEVLIAAGDHPDFD